MSTVDDLWNFSRNWRSTPIKPGDTPLGASVAIYQGDAILRALAACRKAPTSVNVKALIVELGEQIERMRQGDRRNTGGWADFIEYRSKLTAARAGESQSSTDWSNS